MEKTCNKSCKGCPMNITTNYGSEINDIGCLPSLASVKKIFLETGKVWACHENPKVVCKGFLVKLKRDKIPFKITKETILLTEENLYEYSSF